MLDVRLALPEDKVAQLREFHANYCLRGTHGDHKGLWVANMMASKGGITVNSPNWGDLDRNPSLHRFHPLFSDSEADAYRFIDLSAAETWRRIISRRIGIETEVVPMKPAAKV
jgi:hypothetical protein